MNDFSRASALFRQAQSPAARRRPWLKTATRTVSYGELCDRIEKVGGLLASHDVGIGDRVVTAFNDDIDASVILVALICHGVTSVQLDPAAKSERAAALIRRARPSLVLVDNEVQGAWALAAGEWPLVVTPDAPRPGGLASLLGGRAKRGGLDAVIEGLAGVSPPEAIPAQTIAYILFTSGTTGESKGVCISHGALFPHLESLARVYALDADSQVLNTLMLSHADGSIQGPVLAFVTLACVHRPVTFEIGAIERLLDAVFQLRITHMFAVPTMLSLIVRIGASQRDAFQGGDFRYLISCGAQLESALWTRAAETFGISVINSYGLTETTAAGVYAGGGHGSGARGAIGVPVDCDLRIVNEDGTEVSGGQTGELLMRGSLLMSGYFDDEARTGQALRDGWLHTGDIARRDEAGDYWICGRMKSVIIRGGMNIHPEEIVEVLNRHGAVGEAIAFGEPDPEWGETATAVVAAASEVREEELLEFCRLHLEAKKVPGRIVIVAALPKGRSGKVIIEEARALAADRRSRPAGGDLGGSAEQRILAAAAESFGVDVQQLTLASSPANVIGWDSLAHLNLVLAVEKAFAIRLSPRQIMGLDSLGKIAEIVRAR